MSHRIRSSSLLIILLLITGLAGAQTEKATVKTISKTEQAAIKFLNKNYLLLAPEKDSSDKHPIVIYLHGAGGRGDDINKIRNQLPPLWQGIHNFKKSPCYLVAPQVLKKTDGGTYAKWTPKDLNHFLNHLKAAYPIDPNRIYLTGNSMGGYGTWVWSATNPEHFAAVAPISGGIGYGGPKEITPDLKAWAKSLTKIPVYAAVGGKDRVVPPERSELLINEIKKAGGTKATLKIFPEEGHNARSKVYASSEFYEWLFSNSLSDK